MTLTFTCPKCGWPMFCVSTASIPPTFWYQCNCGYKSKLIKESMDMEYAPLPMEYREDGEADDND